VVTVSAGGGISLWAPAAITSTGQRYARRKAALACPGERPHARAAPEASVQSGHTWDGSSAISDITARGIPPNLGVTEIIAFLTHLADQRRVSRSTQMQALSALLLLYREVLATPVGDLRHVLRSASPTRLPAVLSRGEVRALLGQLHGTTRLIALLLYGAGLRLLECLTLRVKDIDFARGEIHVRRGKGGKDRVTMLPDIARPALEKHLVRVRALHTRDLHDGAGRVALPTALDRKAPAWATDLGAAVGVPRLASLSGRRKWARASASRA